MTTNTASCARAFLLKRLFSLSGVFPIGVFVLQHFFGNSFAFVSPEAFNEHSEFLTSLPMVYGLELFGIYLPILFHAVLGLTIAARASHNFGDYGYRRNWMFFAQRVSGIIALIYIATHSYTTRIQSVLAGQKYTFTDMQATLQQPFWFWFYAIGVVAVCFHFANGLWSFLVTWGVLVSRRSQQVFSQVSWALFIALSAWGIAIMTRFL